MSQPLTSRVLCVPPELLNALAVSPTSDSAPPAPSRRQVVELGSIQVAAKLVLGLSTYEWLLDDIYHERSFREIAARENTNPGVEQRRRRRIVDRVAQAYLTLQEIGLVDVERRVVTVPFHV